MKTTIGNKTFVIPFETVLAHANWSEKNFGTLDEHGPVGPLRHLAKEAIEASEAETPEHMLEELADCTFLLLDALRRGGYSVEDLTEAMDRKQKILNTRTYHKVGIDQPIEHDRSIPDKA